MKLASNLSVIRPIGLEIGCCGSGGKGFSIGSDDISHAFKQISNRRTAKVTKMKPWLTRQKLKESNPDCFPNADLMHLSKIVVKIPKPQLENSEESLKESSTKTRIHNFGKPAFQISSCTKLLKEETENFFSISISKQADNSLKKNLNSGSYKLNRPATVQSSRTDNFREKGYINQLTTDTSPRLGSWEDFRITQENECTTSRPIMPFKNTSNSQINIRKVLDNRSDTLSAQPSISKKLKRPPSMNLMSRKTSVCSATPHSQKLNFKSLSQSQRPPTAQTPHWDRLSTAGSLGLLNRGVSGHSSRPNHSSSSKLALQPMIVKLRTKSDVPS